MERLGKDEAIAAIIEAVNEGMTDAHRTEIAQATSEQLDKFEADHRKWLKARQDESDYLGVEQQRRWIRRILKRRWELEDLEKSSG